MYCGALNHKQMTLYFAPAMFSHLLGLCLKQPAMGQKVSPTGMYLVTVLEKDKNDHRRSNCY